MSDSHLSTEPSLPESALKRYSSLYEKRMAKLNQAPRQPVTLIHQIHEFLNQVVKNSITNETEPDWQKEFFNFTNKYELSQDEWVALILSAGTILTQSRT